MKDNIQPRSGDTVWRWKKGRFSKHFGLLETDVSGIHSVWHLTLREGVHRVPLSEFSRDQQVCYEAYQGPSERSEVISRAKSMEGNLKYNLLTTNCEHFVRFCQHGKAKSYQLRLGLSMIAAMGLIMAAFRK